MGPIDWVSITQSAPSIVVALLFAAFAYVLIKEQRAHAGQVMADWREWFTRQDKEWMNQLNMIQQERNDCNSRIAEELKTIGENLRIQNTMLMDHDRRMQSYIHDDNERHNNADKNRNKNIS